LTAAYIGRAEALQAQERWEEAQSTYEEGLAFTPTSAWLLSAYAGFLLDRGDETQALTLIEQAREHVQDVPTMVAIAALYDQVGQNETSEAILQAALAQEPGSVRALIALGDLYEAQGRSSDAQLLYQKVVTLAPGLSTGYLRLAILANKAGDLEAADRYASLAQEVSPESFRP
jgi:tetratricopeptide (TPR) repeat protein